MSTSNKIASNASTSAGSASSSATTASNKATEAANSATQAASYANNVDSFAKEAKSWARGGTGTRVGEDTDNAMYYANEAKSSEINAAASESNAASSESNAASSESNAATSESNASSSASSASTNALKAEGYAVGSQNGTDVESGSPYYQANAKYYKEQAASSATTASTKAGEASTDAATASAKATASESWAVGGTGTRTGEDTNNAKYWAEAAAGAAGGGVTSFNGRSGIVSAAAHDYDADQVDYDNTYSGLTATSVQDAIDEVEGGLGSAASKDVPVSGNASTTQVVMGDDSRLTDARTPVSHTHTKSEITDFPTLGTAAAKNSTNAVTQSSSDLVESGAVYSEVSSLNSALSNKADSSKAYQTDDTTETTLASDDVLPFYDTSATAKRKMSVQKFAEQLISNRNLLDNPWFTVNQRGFTSSTSIGYIADRWLLAYNPDSAQVSLENSILTVDASGATNERCYIVQKVEQDYSGLTLTTSVLLSDGTIYKGTGIMPSLNGADFGVIDNDKFYCYYQHSNSASSGYCCLGIAVKIGKTVSIKAIKLEIGAVSTLALDTAPNYATELLKCQRYFVRFKTNGNSALSAGGICGIIAANNATRDVYLTFALPVAMRANPTISSDDFSKWFFYTGNTAGTAALIKNLSDLFFGRRIANSVLCVGVISYSNDTKYGQYGQIWSDTDGSYIDFSAEL